MMKIPDFTRGLVRISRRLAGLAAATLLVLSAAPGQRAEALSLVNPGAAPTAKYASEGLATEVHGGRGGGGGGFHGGGGGGFHGGGGGFHGGSAVFRGGGFRSGPVFHGGGIRYGGFRYGGYRHGGYRFAHHRHFRGGYYGYYGPYYYHRCRIIWTYYGPRRVCHYHHWHRWYGFPFPFVW